MQTDPRRPTQFHDHVAAVERAEARYLEAWRGARAASIGEEAKGEAALAAAAQRLREVANDAVRTLARLVEADALVDHGGSDGLSVELHGRVLWYTLDRDGGRPGWIGRDDRGEDVPLESHEVEHWVRAGAVQPN